MNIIHSKCKRSATGLTARLRRKLTETRGDFIMDHAMVAVVILVVGAIIIAALGPYIQDTLFPLLQGKITDFFN